MNDRNTRPTPFRRIPPAPAETPATATAYLEAPVPPALATIPALRAVDLSGATGSPDPADRAFPHPRRSVPGKPNSLLRSMFRK